MVWISESKVQPLPKPKVILLHTMEEGRALKRNASQEAEQVVPPKEPRKEDDISSMEDEEDKKSNKEQDMTNKQERVKEKEEKDEKKKEEDGEKEPSWAKAMGSNLFTLIDEMKKVNTKVDEAVSTAKEAKVAVATLQTEVTTLRDDYTAFKDNVGATVSTVVKDEVSKAMKERIGFLGDGADSDPDADHPERLVIVSGWPAGTPEKTIVDRLQVFVEVNALQGRVAQVFCYNEEAMSGVLKCRTEAGRNALLRGSWRLTDKQISEDRIMKFGKKLTVFERADEKRLGFIKHEVMTKFGVGVKDVKIMWAWQQVEFKGEKIFKVKKNGQRIYSGVGKEISQNVEAKVADWLKKRNQEDSD